VATIWEVEVIPFILIELLANDVHEPEVQLKDPLTVNELGKVTTKYDGIILEEGVTVSWRLVAYP
jgi:hypothetical protein